LKELNIKYTNWKHNILETQENKAKERWYPTVDKDFLPHLMPILAAIPLIRNSPESGGKISSKLTYDALAGIKVKTINGIIDGDQIQALLWVLAKLPRGKLMPGLVQTKFSTYASFTPLALYAQKLHNNIKYNEWEQNPKDRYLALFISVSLFEAFASIKKGGKPIVDALKVKSLRKQSLTYATGVKAGEMEAVTSNKCNLKTLPARVGGKLEEVPYSKPVIYMALQTWIANSQCRDTDSMLLDLNDWDNIQKALDAGIVKIGSKKHPPSEDTFSIDDL